MATTTRRKLPPMSVLEFAIAQALRRYFFSIRLVMTWLLVIAPLAAALFWFGLGGQVPDFQAPSPIALAGAGAIAIMSVLAALSMAVNWYRRAVLDERPRGWLWWRLDRPVWRLLAAILMLLATIAVFALLAVLAMVRLKDVLEPQVGPAAETIALAVAVLLGVIAYFVAFRLSGKLPAVASGVAHFGFAKSWRATRRSNIRIISHTFWLAFTLAIVAAIGAGAYFASTMTANPWAKGGAFAVIGVLAWFVMLVLATIPAGLCRYFGQGREFEDS